MNSSSQVSPPVRMAFIGLGWWGEILGEAARASGGIEVSGGFARTPATREAFTAKFGGKGFDSLETLLADQDTEAVAIISPNKVHKEQAIAAARAGKHVHLEKPMALSVSDAKAIVAACEEAGVVLHIGQNFRRWPLFRKTKELLEAGRLGAVSLATCFFTFNHGLVAGPKSMRWDPEENPGGPLYSYLIHMGDMMETLFGEILEVQAMCGKVGGPSPVDDAASGVFRLKSGMVASISGSYVSPPYFSFEIQGMEGNLSLSSAHPPTLQARDGQMQDAEVLDVGCDFTEGRHIANREQFEDFARCIREGGTPEVTGIHGVRALAIMRAMLRSHRERRLVTIAEVMGND